MATKPHVMRHPDPPTWCVHCGTFDVYCGPEDCAATGPGRYDNSDPDTYARMFTGLFPGGSFPADDGRR